MTISRYKKAFFYFGLYCGIIIVLLAVLDSYRSDQDFSLFLPGTGFLEAVLLFTIFWPLGIIIGGFFSGYISTPLFLFLHKKIIGITINYGIQENQESRKFKSIIKGIFPSIEEEGKFNLELKEDLCIGCGVCSTNCATKRLILEKVENKIPVDSMPDAYRKYGEERFMNRLL